VTLTKPEQKRSCNRHRDCDAADEETKARAEEKGVSPNHWARFGAEHCHDEGCSDCFGN
jgi:hypothetical protein